MSGLNTTVVDAEFVHGTNPQFLIEKITRQKIYDSIYWKQHCFGLNEETLLEKAVDLRYIGGVYGSLSKPTKFMCLVLKMLQLSPDMDVVAEYISQHDFKYLTALGLFYLRLVGKAHEVYLTMEKCYSDFRKIRVRKLHGWGIMHMDEFVDDLLRESSVLDMALPRLPLRRTLEGQARLSVYQSPLQAEWDEIMRDKSTSCGDCNDRKEDGKEEGEESGGPANKRRRTILGVSHRSEGRNRQNEQVASILSEQKEREREQEREGSVRWWNKRRAILGLKPLNVPEE